MLGLCCIFIRSYKNTGLMRTQWLINTHGKRSADENPELGHRAEAGREHLFKPKCEIFPLNCSGTKWMGRGKRLGKIPSSILKLFFQTVAAATAAAAAKSLQSCRTLCDPRDGSPPGYPVSGKSCDSFWRCVALAEM